MPSSPEASAGSDSHPVPVRKHTLFMSRVIVTMVKIAAAIAVLLGLTSASPAAVNANTANRTSSKLVAASTSFWYANMDHTGAARGYAPDLGNDFSYSVYVAVNPGDGNGLRNAITDDRSAKRHPKWLASQPRVGVRHSDRVWLTLRSCTFLLEPTRSAASSNLIPIRCSWATQPM